MTKAGLDYKNIDYVVFYEKPFVKFERILRTHIQYFPFGLSTFNKAIPIGLKNVLICNEPLQRNFVNFPWENKIGIFVLWSTIYHMRLWLTILQDLTMLPYLWLMLLVNELQIVSCTVMVTISN